MLHNYLIIAWRNLWNNKVFSLINIIGLAVAMASCLLIYLYISFERSYDSFHENGKNIYRLIGTRIIDGVQDGPQSTLSPSYGILLQSNFPEIEDYTRLYPEAAAEFSIQSDHLAKQSSPEEKVFYADPAFLDMFSFPLLVGDANTALDEPNNIIITESLAKKYFGWESSINQPNKILDQIMSFDKFNYKITGVVKDIPNNSHIKFNALISMETLKSWWSDFDEGGAWQESVIYYRLNPNADIKILTDNIRELFEKKSYATFTFYLQPISEIHLRSAGYKGEWEVRGNIQIIRFLMIICLFILAIAWTNYINLTTARSMKRAKEVGIKKIVGAGKKQLIEQFLLESTIINLVAILLAITLVQVLLPYFEKLVGEDLQVNLVNSDFLIIIPVFLVLGVIVSGLYPALLLSSFKSISMLTGVKIRWTNKAGLRKALVVVQYMITFSLILGTFTVYKQLSHMRNSALGFNMQQMLIVRAPKFNNSDIGAAKFNVFKNNLRPQKGITGVTASNDIPGGKNLGGALRFTSILNNEEIITFFPVVSVDPDFFETYEIKLKYGRMFSNIIGKDQQSIIIMEQTARNLGFVHPEDALHAKIYTTKQNRKMNDKTPLKTINPTVLGIVDDYNHNSLKAQLQPLIFQKVNSIKTHRPFLYYSIRLEIPEGGYDQLSELISLVKKNYREVFKESSFSYFFLDDYFNSQYRSEQKFGIIFGIFSILAIVIACLGMFGLSLFTLHQRTKEIGIRKAHGASITGILVLLSKEFIKLIIISILVAIPITFVPLRGWLQTFAYRIDLSWWLFAIPAIVITVIALLTISYQSIKAALANPVKSLRYE